MFFSLSSAMLLGYTTNTQAVVGDILTPKANDIVNEVQTAINGLGVLAIIVIGFLIFFSKAKKAGSIAVGVIVGYIIIYASAQIWAWVQA